MGSTMAVFMKIQSSFLVKNTNFRALSTALKQVNEKLDNELQEIRNAGTWKAERVITSQQDVGIAVHGSEGKILNFCANNYLGLSNHPNVTQAGIDALKTHGAGLSSVRFICGTQDIHKKLEGQIAEVHGREDSILYASCFDANAGLFEQILGPEDAVFSDALNHASIIDGIRLCKAKKYRYEHKNMEDLEAKLAEAKDAKIKLIATDGVFSMDRNVAPLKDIVDLAKKYGALTFIDECHATGFFGETGRGTEEFFGLDGQIDIINSTLGKALGGAAGGYTTASQQIISLLRQRARPYLFSNSLPPPVVASASQVFSMLMKDSSLVSQINENTKRFRDGMTKAGFTISGEDHPICPVMIGDAALATQMADDMLARGIFVIGFSYPVVPKGKARIRVQISAAHTTEDIDRTVNAFIEVGKLRNVI